MAKLISAAEVQSVLTALNNDAEVVARFFRQQKAVDTEIARLFEVVAQAQAAGIAIDQADRDAIKTKVLAVLAEQPDTATFR